MIWKWPNDNVAESSIHNTQANGKTGLCNSSFKYGVMNQWALERFVKGMGNDLFNTSSQLETTHCNIAAFGIHVVHEMRACMASNTSSRSNQ